MCVVREELFRNAIVIKSTFRGEKHGHLRSVQRPDVYHTEAGQAWTIPTSGGMYLTFSVGATDEEKKREVAEFINRETHIKIAELVKEFLKKPTPQGGQRGILYGGTPRRAPVRRRFNLGAPRAHIFQLDKN